MPGAAKVKPPPRDSAKFWLPLCRKFDPTCVGYLQAIIDSASLDKANGRVPYWCSSQGVTLAQISRIIIDKLDTEREQWSQPFIVLATDALQEKLPCHAPFGEDGQENSPDNLERTTKPSSANAS
jgi:Rap1a immunity proteins